MKRTFVVAVLFAASALTGCDLVGDEKASASTSTLSVTASQTFVAMGPVGTYRVFLTTENATGAVTYSPGTPWPSFASIDGSAVAFTPASTETGSFSAKVLARDEANNEGSIAVTIDVSMANLPPWMQCGCECHQACSGGGSGGPPPTGGSSDAGAVDAGGPFTRATYSGIQIRESDGGFATWSQEYQNTLQMTSQPLFLTNVYDSDGLQVRLQVEAEAAGTPFTNVPNWSSDFVDGGETAVIHTDGFTPGVQYEIRFGIEDSSGLRDWDTTLNTTIAEPTRFVIVPTDAGTIDPDAGTVDPGS